MHWHGDNLAGPTSNSTADTASFRERTSMRHRVAADTLAKAGFWYKFAIVSYVTSGESCGAPRRGAEGGVWHQRIPSWRDLVAVLLVLGTVILLGTGARQMLAPFVIAHQPEISLSPAALPFYTLRTVMRMLVALILTRPWPAKTAGPRWC